jgi:hypothetical protein
MHREKLYPGSIADYLISPSIFAENSRIVYWRNKKSHRWGEKRDDFLSFTRNSANKDC